MRERRTNDSSGRTLWPLLLGLWLGPGCVFHIDAIADPGSADLAPHAPAADLAIALDPDLALPPADLAPTGHLTVSSAPTAAMIDLTALGTSDWVHWGFAKVTDVDRKATGNSQISAVSVTDNSTVLDQYTPFPTVFTWSDGSSDGGGHPASPGNSGAVYVNSGGMQLTAPAGLASRKVVIYVSYVNAQAHMQIALSDGSATAYGDSAYNSSDNGLHDVAYSVDYSAASEGQQLTITWSLATGNPLGGARTPAVALEAMTLDPPAVPTP